MKEMVLDLNPSIARGVLGRSGHCPCRNGSICKGASESNALHFLPGDKVHIRGRCRLCLLVFEKICIEENLKQKVSAWGKQSQVKEQNKVKFHTANVWRRTVSGGVAQSHFT